MDIKFQRETITMISRILDRKHSTETVIPRMIQKPISGTVIQSNKSERSLPEKEGFDSDRIEAFYREIEENGTVFPHNIVIMKNGKVISEKNYVPYKSEYRHMTHSFCKTLTGLAIGMLIDDGVLSINDSIQKIFGNELTPLAKMLQTKCTVRHLLNMSSGTVFNETGAITETEWVKCFLESATKFIPGTDFQYNSMNSYMLSAIVTKLTGKKLVDFLNERLFCYLGINDVLWEGSPEGYNKGGWGLYLCIEDMAKIGQLLLNKGLWNGKRIVSENWIKEATREQNMTPAYMGDYNYGYQLWVGRENSAARRSFLINGMLGQNVICWPDNNFLIAITGGNGDNFQQNVFFNIANKYFGADSDKIHIERKTENNQKHEMKIKNCSFNRIFDEKLNRLCGKDFRFIRDYTASVGIVPLSLQIVENNYSNGLEYIRFDKENNKYFLKIHETDMETSIPINLFNPEYSDIKYHGDQFSIASQSKLTKDEDGNSVLIVKISFIETPYVRIIKIYFNDDYSKIHVKFDETPGTGALLEAIKLAVSSAKTNKISDIIFSKADIDFLIYKIKTVIEPEFTGKTAEK